MIKRIKKFIDKQIRRIVREELDNIFCKNGEIAVDHHIKQNSWAVIKIDSGPGSCYLKFVDLGKDDLIKIQKFMSQFERQHIDAAPHIEHEFNKMYDTKTLFNHNLMKVRIEKELCNPVNGKIVGPKFHVFKVDEETRKKELLETFDGDITKAARFAERNLDFDVLEIAYKEDPNIFSSTRHS